MKCLKCMVGRLVEELGQLALPYTLLWSRSGPVRYRASLSQLGKRAA
jgi:hypothetical protein